MDLPFSESDLMKLFNKSLKDKELPSVEFPPLSLISNPTPPSLEPPEELPPAIPPDPGLSPFPLVPSGFGFILLPFESEESEIKGLYF